MKRKDDEWYTQKIQEKQKEIDALKRRWNEVEFQYTEECLSLSWEEVQRRKSFCSVGIEELCDDSYDDPSYVSLDMKPYNCGEWRMDQCRIRLLQKQQEIFGAMRDKGGDS